MQLPDQFSPTTRSNIDTSRRVVPAIAANFSSAASGADVAAHAAKIAKI